MRHRWIVVSWVLCLLATSAPAQVDSLRFDIEQGFVGLDRYIRPGDWTAIRLNVDNLSADDREVVFRWELQDDDGDRVLAQRQATLTRQREDQLVWLYAPTPYDTSSQTVWTLRALDAQSGELLAAQQVSPASEGLLGDSQNLIAVTSAADLGLNDVVRQDTSHSAIRLIRGLSLGRLPDRWQGLTSLQAIIWTPDQGDDPADPLQVSEASLASLREWIWRGGQLVIVLPQFNQTWGQSPLADLLPVKPESWVSRESRDWWKLDSVGGLIQPSVDATDAADSLTVTTFDIEEGQDGATILLRDFEQRPLVVTARRGFGTVTLVGLDLTAPAVRRSGLNTGEHRIWHDIFGWKWPALTPEAVEREQRAQRIYTASNLSQQNRVVDLGRFIPSQIAMTGTVSSLLLGSVFGFGLYWLLAGWLLQPLLKSRGLTQYSWTAFLGVVCLTALLAWGAAWILRPNRTNVDHFTILDFDGNANLVQGRSYLSLFVPRFGTAEVETPRPALRPLPAGPHNLISSPGFNRDAAVSGFVDTQDYIVEADAPDHLPLPVRSTTKELLLQYLGPVDGDMAGLHSPFTITATRPITADDNGWPTGEITHTLPGTLSNVLLIYCPGEQIDTDGRRRPRPAQVWRYLNDNGENLWPSGQILKLQGIPQQLENLVPPFRSWAQLPTQRDLSQEGLLGKRVGELGGPQLEVPLGVDQSTVARHLELLTFFDSLPPPLLKQDPKNPSLSNAYVLGRPLSHRIDLTRLLPGRRIILLAQAKDTPLPLPLAVDGQTPPSSGDAFIRWIYDF